MNGSSGAGWKRLGGQWRHQGVDLGGHFYPSFSGGWFSNFSKSVEKTWEGWFSLTVDIWLCSFGCLHCTSLFRCLLLQKCPPLQKMMLEKAAFPTFWNRSKILKRAFATFSESLKGVVEKNFPLLFVHPTFFGLATPLPSLLIIHYWRPSAFFYQPMTGIWV